MDRIEAEVISQHYAGPIQIEPAGQNDHLFYVHTTHSYLGRLCPFHNKKQIVWYSPDITDKELLCQIGEWIECSYKI
jgi:hypothetical protein